jgi:hypothetical protein
MLEQGIEPGLVDRDLASLEHGDPIGVLIDAGYSPTKFSEAGS